MIATASMMEIVSPHHEYPPKQEVTEMEQPVGKNDLGEVFVERASRAHPNEVRSAENSRT